jgi:hypothetical protein
MIFFFRQDTKAGRFMSNLVTSLDVYEFCTLPCREATGHFKKIWRGVFITQHVKRFMQGTSLSTLDDFLQ